MPSDPTTPISKVVATPADQDTPEVQGHAFKKPGPAVDAPAEAEVQGHKARYFGTEQTVPQAEDDEDVEGHLSRWGAMEQPEDGDDESEVQGHITSPLNHDIATNQTRNRVADAERIRRAKESSNLRDGGILDKITRRKTSS